MHRRLADLKPNYMAQTGNTLWKNETDFMIFVFVLHTFLRGTYIWVQL